MPQVGNKKFPYTPAGIKQAQKAYERKRNPVASAMNKGILRSRLTGAMDRLGAQSKLRDARSAMRNQSAVDQLKAQVGQRSSVTDRLDSVSRVPTQPNRRQKIAGAMDKVYRPDRDGPKRVAQTLPRPSGIRLPRPSRGVASRRLPGRKPRPGRGALAPRPWRPKPPNRRYL